VRRLALALAATAGLLAGCGSSSSTTVISNSTVTQTVTTPPSTSSSTSSTTTTTASTTTTTPTSRLTFFASPSGNIGCVMSARSARCDIKDRAWKPPPAPASCPLDYGQGVEVTGPAKATLVCAGDTALGATKVLPYGQSSRVGSFLCTSETTAMKCGNADTGHGFELSRDSYKLF